MEMTEEHKEVNTRGAKRPQVLFTGPKRRERSKATAHGMTYADWLTKAIQSTAEQKLTLSEIYDWFVLHVPGLSGQRYLHSSKGWKNAVRHTLSVNQRFCKIARPGRPSFWTVTSAVTLHHAIKPHYETIKQSPSAAPCNRDNQPDHIAPMPTICKTTVEQDIDKEMDQKEVSGLNYTIQYFQLPLALLAATAVAAAAETAVVAGNFRPKPSTNFRTSPTSAFVRFRPSQHAIGSQSGARAKNVSIFLQ